MDNNAVATAARPVTIDGRGPNFSVISPLSGAVTINVRLSGSVRTPAWIGLKRCPASRCDRRAGAGRPSRSLELS